jgi:predicted DNA-binding transcriptional regulator AlpA
MMNDQKNSLTEQEAARYVGVSPAVFRLWRAEGTGPNYFRAGVKLIRYLRRDLDAWIEARLSRHTTAEDEASHNLAR